MQLTRCKCQSNQSLEEHFAELGGEDNKWGGRTMLEFL